MASASSLARFNLSDIAPETIEIDPQYAQALGFAQGDIVRVFTVSLIYHGQLYSINYSRSKSVFYTICLLQNL